MTASTLPRHHHDHHDDDVCEEAGDDGGGSSNTSTAHCSAYVQAAQPHMYRVADRVLYACAAHGDGVVLCCAAGKTGRRTRRHRQASSVTAATTQEQQQQQHPADKSVRSGHGEVAAVGATLLWLTCAHLNAFVARVELHGGVRVAMCCLRECALARAAHVRAHVAYEQLAATLLTPSQWRFFSAHFVNTPACDSTAHNTCTAAADASAAARASAAAASAAPHTTPRRYGNAAVGHAEDVKCLHALVAQTLAGAHSPVGVAVLNYLLFLHDLLPHESSAVAASTTCNTASPTTKTSRAHAALRALLDSPALLERFLRCALTDARLCDDATAPLRPLLLCIDVPELRTCVDDEAQHIHDSSNGDDGTRRTHVYRDVQAMQQLQPDLCRRAYDVLCFVHGHAPHSARKRRRN